MPVLVQQPRHYYTSPFPPTPCSTWINAPQVHLKPQSPNIPGPPAPNALARKVPKPTQALPVKPTLRSILKPPHKTKEKKSVHFTSSTASPPQAAPRTYKLAGKPQPPKAQHPARGHRCLTSLPQQRAQQAMAAVQLPPQAQSQYLKQASRSSSLQQQQLTGHVSRLQTPPPPDFFQRAGNAQYPVQRFQIRARHQPAQQQATKRPAPKQIPAYNVYYSESYSSDSEDSNTDIGMVRMVKHMEQRQAKINSTTSEADIAATRRSIKALAKEYDRKNAWRRPR